MKRTQKIAKLITPILFVVLELSAVFLIFSDRMVKHNFLTDMSVEIKKIYLSAVSDWKYRSNLESYNTGLIEENTRLKKELEAIKTMMGDSLMMKRVSHLPDSIKSNFHFIPAKVVMNNTANRINYFYLNKGAIDGVREYMGVVTPKGILGIVNSVSENACSVVSIISQGISVSAKIKNSEIYGPVIWSGNSRDEGILTEIPHHLQVNIGDTVVTSGLSSVFPSNIPIGIIKSTSMSKAGFQDVKIEYTENYKKVMLVTITGGKLFDEIEELQEED